MGRAHCFSLAAVAAAALLFTGCVGGSAPSVGGRGPLAGRTGAIETSSVNRLAGDPALGPGQAASNAVISADVNGPAATGAGNRPPASTYQRLTDAVKHNPVLAAVGAAVGRGTAMFKQSAWKVSHTRNTNKSDLLSLTRKTPPPRANLYVSLARISEQAGNTEHAAAQYEKALKTEPGDLDALLGYAHLLDRQGRFDEAVERYRKAIAKHPDNPTVYNDLALCFARGGRFDESVETLQRAIALVPNKELYRNNLAIVLIEMARTDQALAQLTEVHGEATAHYNLGFLLQQRGHQALAADHFAAALRLDPQNSQAAAWLARLGRSTPQVPAAAPPTNVVVSNASSASVPSAAVVSPERPPQPAYPESWRAQPVTDGPVHLPNLQSPQQAVMPPTPDTLDRYPTSAAPTRGYAY